MGKIYGENRYDSTYLFADSYNSTATSYEITESPSGTDFTLDTTTIKDTPMAFNVELEKITAVGTETYNLEIIEGDAADFSGSNNVLAQIDVDKATPLGMILEGLKVIPGQFQYLGCRMIGANTPDWTLSIWASPAE